MRKIFLTAFALLAFAIPAMAQQKDNGALTFLNDLAGDIAPVTTACTYDYGGDVDQLCILLGNDSLVPLVAESRIKLLVGTLARSAFADNRLVDARTNAANLVIEWYDLLKVESKPCALAFQPLFSGEARLSIFPGGCSGQPVEDFFRRALAQCTGGTNAACTVDLPVWGLIQRSIPVARSFAPNDAKAWDVLEQAANRYVNGSI